MLIIATLILFLISILFAACTVDDVDEQVSKSTDILETSEAQQLRMPGDYPENIANIYDVAGQLYYDLSEEYLDMNYSYTFTSTTIDNVELLANANSEFQLLLHSSYISPSATRIDYILTSPQGDSANIIAGTDMSANAKLSLSTFLNTLMTYSDSKTEYDSIYNFVIAYETSVISDTSFSAKDTKILLTTSSLSRYSFFAASRRRRKPRDRDWEMSWGCITAGIEGSNHSVAEAIVKSMVCDLIVNK